MTAVARRLQSFPGRVSQLICFKRRVSPIALAASFGSTLEGAPSTQFAPHTALLKADAHGATRARGGHLSTIGRLRASVSLSDRVGAPHVSRLISS